LVKYLTTVTPFRDAAHLSRTLLQQQFCSSSSQRRRPCS